MAVATERLVLNPGTDTELDLNHGPVRVASDGPDWGEAAVEQAMADAARGQLPVDQRIGSRTISIPLVLGADRPEEFREARARLQTTVAALQINGGLLWRGGGKYRALNADIVDAKLTLPERRAHQDVETDVMLVMQAIPDFYSDEVGRRPVTSTGPDLMMVVQGILGDYPARVRIVLADSEQADKDGLLWGIRSRHYDPDPAARVIWRAADLTAVSPATVTSGVVERTGVAQAWVGLVNWQTAAGNRPVHTGSYRVWARVQASVAGVRCRLRWGVGDLSAATTNTAALVPTAGAWHMVDLGEVRLDPVSAGHHHWLSQLQARADTGTATVTVEKLYLQSLELAGRLWVPPDHEPDAVLPAGLQAELRTDGMLRHERNPGADPLGYQPVSHVVGDLPRLFPGANEILLRASRGDLDSRPDPDLPATSFTAQIYYRPSYITAIPPVGLLAPPVTYPVTGGVIREQDPLIAGTAEPGNTIELIIDDLDTVAVRVSVDGSWSHRSDWLWFGVHTFWARQVDPFGNLSPETLVSFLVRVWSWDDLLADVVSNDELLERFATNDDVVARVEK